ncbi:hypothetical protein TRVL_01969 [Trypanosoma vivax]|nr:hypothetical protein TRVL_01969 [Trypanosoma vivax]
MKQGEISGSLGVPPPPPPPGSAANCLSGQPRPASQPPMQSHVDPHKSQQTPPVPFSGLPMASQQPLNTPTQAANSTVSQLPPSSAYPTSAQWLSAGHMQSHSSPSAAVSTGGPTPACSGTGCGAAVPPPLSATGQALPLQSSSGPMSGVAHLGSAESSSRGGVMPGAAGGQPPSMPAPNTFARRGTAVPSSVSGMYPTAQYGSGGYNATMPTFSPTGIPSAAGDAHNDGDLSCFDISKLSSRYHELAQKLITLSRNMDNTPRRLSVSKAIMELFKMLQMGSLSPEAITLVTNYVNAVGTSEAKNAWRQLSERCFQDIQPFVNLKFL